MFDSVPALQLVSFGEQNCPSTVQGVPLVTLWLLLPQVQRTVSPTEMVTVLGENTSIPLGPTVTSKIVLVGDRGALGTTWPF